jgi:DNA repair exonuclease SbcCD ATPase subunit
MNCQYCKTIFKSTSALKNHINKARYCIVIQEKLAKKEKKIYKCEYCDKILSTKQSLTKHKETCCKKKDKDDEIKDKENKDKLLRKLKDEVIEKDKIIIKVNTQLENSKEQLENFKEQLEKREENFKEQEENYKEQIKDLQEKLDKIANKAIDRPTTVVSNTTTNNNLNIVSSLDFNNFDRIKDAIENKLNVNHVVDGQKGLAKFMVDTILTDEEGNLLYVCTDPSRNMFKYKNTDGEINKDVEAKKLISFMVDAGIKVKSVEIAREWCKNGDENGEVDITKYGIMTYPQEKIMKIEDENSRFKRELASMTSVN